jgi:hypothetical protein
MWEKIKNILYRNLNMSFGLSGKNVFISSISTVTNVTGNWCALQILSPYAAFNITIDGQYITSGDIIEASTVTTGLIIYGNITQFDVSDGYFRLYAGTNLGV